MLLYEFGPDMEAYLAGRTANSPRTMADLVEFNREHADVELKWFGQEHMIAAAELPGLDAPEYLAFLEQSRDGSRAQLDQAFGGERSGRDHRADRFASLADRPDQRRPLHGR